MTEDFRIFLATVWGEAAGSSVAAQRAIASVIMNRIGVREWAAMKTPREVIRLSGFDAYWAENKPYREAYAAFGPIPTYPMTARLRALEDGVRAIYEHLEEPVTNAVLYFSPKAMAALHRQNPKLYKLFPAWTFGRLEEVQPPGLLLSDDFRFFTYRKAGA